MTDKLVMFIDASAKFCEFSLASTEQDNVRVRGQLVIGPQRRSHAFDIDSRNSEVMRTNLRLWRTGDAPNLDDVEEAADVPGIETEKLTSSLETQEMSPERGFFAKEVDEILKNQMGIETLDMIEEHSRMSLHGRKDLSVQLNTFVAQQSTRIEALRHRIQLAPDGTAKIRILLNSGSFSHVWLGLMLAGGMRMSLQKDLIDIYGNPPEGSERLSRLGYRLLLPDVRRQALEQYGRRPYQVEGGRLHRSLPPSD